MLVREALIYGLVDWVRPDLVESDLVEFDICSGQADRRLLTMAVTMYLVAEDLAVPGNTIGGFSQWEGGKGDWLLEIHRKFVEVADKRISAGEIVWLQLTPKGEAAGERYLERRGPLSDDD